MIGVPIPASSQTVIIIITSVLLDSVSTGSPTSGAARHLKRTKTERPGSDEERCFINVLLASHSQTPGCFSQGSHIQIEHEGQQDPIGSHRKGIEVITLTILWDTSPLVKSRTNLEQSCDYAVIYILYQHPMFNCIKGH